MAFIPFYIPGRKRLRVIIVGGGYAGIAALTVLSHHVSNLDIIILDSKDQHIKITHLHETFRCPLADLLVPFSDLELRFGCRHINTTLAINESSLQQWQKDKFVVINDEVLAFDYLLIASGCVAMESAHTENVLILSDFMDTAGSDLLSDHLANNKKNEPSITVIGGGATGIQFLFEIVYFLKRQKVVGKLSLIDGEDCVLKQFPAGFAHYVQSRMRDLGIDYYAHTYFKEQLANTVLLENKKTGYQFELPSVVSLLFPGKNQNNILDANAFGQVMAANKPLPNIFVAGDCSNYKALGSNSLTAQSAVRKGKLAARNLLRHSGVLKLLEPYLHRDLGYVVRLGPTDAVGWLALEGNVVHGLPALVIKEVVETQYDLLLTGIDTYLI